MNNNNNQQTVDLTAMSTEQLISLAGNIALNIKSQDNVLGTILTLLQDRQAKESANVATQRPIVLPKLKKLDL